MALAGNNVPVACVDPIFSSQIGKLKFHADTIWKGELNLGQRFWQVPEPFRWDNDVFHILGPNGILGAYDRTCPNLIYIRAFKKEPPKCPDGGAPAGEGRDADCMVEKIQIDYLAQQERAFRARHATPIRNRMHSMTRRRAQSPWGDRGPLPDEMPPIGGIFTSVIRHLLILIDGGYNESKPITEPPTLIATNHKTNEVIALT